MNINYTNDYTNLYKMNHIIIGFLIGLTKCKYILIIAILIYQLIQLICNIRFFIYNFEIKKGNSLQHTINKLFDYLFSFIIIIIFIKIIK